MIAVIRDIGWCLLCLSMVVVFTLMLASCTYSYWMLHEGNYLLAAVYYIPGIFLTWLGLRSPEKWQGKQ